MLTSRPSRLKPRGVARDRHDTRGGDAVAARDRSVLSNEGADERSVADVKSQRPDTPKLVFPVACASIVAAWWPTSRRTRETAYKREDHRAGNAGCSRLNLW
ncbi:hypothetical protein BRAO285_220019 [Bradyrhizobium sp. ORS 285]|nr:hypothetical protein BRAO285_220019 [Bradyrhizobium sp. ORS 285]